MSDLHADLIGFEFQDDDGITYRVTSVWDATMGYVLVHDGYQDHIRPAGIVRRRKQLDETNGDRVVIKETGERVKVTPDGPGWKIP